jgi:hypothetical protein
MNVVGGYVSGAQLSYFDVNSAFNSTAVLGYSVGYIPQLTGYLGKTTIGGFTGGNIGGYNLETVKSTSPYNANITSVSLYVTTANNYNYRVCIYNDSSSYPSQVLWDSGNVTLSNANAWNTINLTIPLQIKAGSTYWFGIQQQATSGGLAADTQTGSSYLYSMSYQAFPNPYPSAKSTWDYVYSVYATYTITS